MKETAEKLKQDYDLDLFMETSAKTGMNTQELFIEAAKLLFKDYKKYKANKAKKPVGETLHKENKNDKEKKKGCC